MIKINKNTNILETFKWFGVGILVILEFLNHYYYTNLSIFLHSIITISIIGISIKIISLTNKGKRFFF
ncbi:MAG: hypothetical protein U0T61_00190 [Buchnera aphidicola (Melaphis rhois)]